MSFGPLRKRYQALPLRAKLTLWNTLVVVLVTAVALICVREGLRWMLLKELKVSLEDEAYEIALSISQPREAREGVYDEMERTSAGHLRHGWFLQLFDDASQKALWSSENTPGAFLTAGTLAANSMAGEYRIAERPLESTEAPHYRVRVGTSLDFIEEDVTNVTRIITPVLVAVMLLAPAGGYALAGRATAPLQKILSSSRSLHPSRLNDRLPLRQTGDELDQLSEEINNFLDQIASHLRRNREFVANAAHELRSPLSAIITSLEVALSRDRTVAEYQELLANLHDECEELATMVNQLLLLAESDAGLLNVQPIAVSLGDVVASSIQMFNGVAEEKGVAVVSELDLRTIVPGEPTRLRQVMNNLLDNAIKFTSPGGRIRVSLARDREADEAVLAVQDTGEGIPYDDQNRVFDRFHRVDRSRDARRSSGLGLSICLAIVEAHGGRIELVSDPGAGSTFTVRLPLLSAVGLSQ